MASGKNDGLFKYTFLDIRALHPCWRRNEKVRYKHYCINMRALLHRDGLAPGSTTGYQSLACSAFDEAAQQRQPLKERMLKALGTTVKPFDVVHH
ncbi:hypothetical protein H0A71_10945 [Alcaligenaceae bacterium]|nr:hypothetical protein [Alcaligenaceae bacterium]